MDDQQRDRELLAAHITDLRAAAAMLRTEHPRISGLADEFDLAADELNLVAVALRAAPEWQPIDTAPKDDRVLVRCESGSVYAAHWVQNPMTGDEAWLVCALEDGTQMLVHPVEWMPLPLAARPQGEKDA